MNSMFLGRLRAVSLSSIALALGLAGATAPAPAFAAPVVTYTCVAEVSTGFAPAYSPGPSGGAVLATQTFSGPTLQSVVGQCHQFARNAFAANTAWSDPIKFCQRYALANYEQTAGNNSKTRLVWVSNYFQQMGKTNGVNRVGGYSVICDGPANIQKIDPTAALEPTIL